MPATAAISYCARATQTTTAGGRYMRRTLTIVAAIVACLAAPATAGATLIYVGNTSTEVPQIDVERALPAFQTAVTRDFAPVWGTDATLTTDPALKNSADMVLTIADEPDCWGCLGYHTVEGRRPVGFVWADLCAYYQDSWQLVLTHELFEMLADPWINRYAVWNRKVWLTEVADPIEDGSYAYLIGDVVISDFVMPKFYDGRLRGPIDFTHGLSHPGQIGVHGYASWRKANGTWGQIFNGKAYFFDD